MLVFQSLQPIREARNAWCNWLAFHFSTPGSYLYFDWSTRQEHHERCQQFMKETFISERHTKVQFLWLQIKLTKQNMKFVDLDCFLSLQILILLFWQSSLWRLSMFSFLLSSTFLWCPRSWSSGRESDALKPKDTRRQIRELRKSSEFLQY